MSKVLSKDELNKNMDFLSKSWSIEGLYLKGSYSFNNFDNAFSFMKEVAIKCEEMNHHPKWTNVYNKLDIELYTHDLGGITEKDFELFLRWYEEGKFPLDKMITKRYSLAQINEACHDLESGEIFGRAILEY